MDISKKTIDIIKFFSTINSNLVLDAGNELKTRSVARDIFATATIDETIPKEFPIYNTQEFISAISIFKEPTLDFEDSFMRMKDKQQKGIALKYVPSKKEHLVYPDKELKEPTYDVEFDMTYEEIQSILKAAAIIKASDIEIESGASGVCIKVFDRKNSSSNDFQLQVNDSPAKEGSFLLKVEKMKLFQGDYHVSVCEKGLISFVNKDVPVKIYISLEKK